jgi:hypothetical protein
VRVGVYLMLSLMLAFLLSPYLLPVHCPMALDLVVLEIAPFLAAVSVVAALLAWRRKHRLLLAFSIFVLCVCLLRLGVSTSWGPDGIWVRGD